MTPQALVICPIVGVLVVLLAGRRLETNEKRLIGLAFALHVVATIALVVYHEHIFGGDMLMYAMFGKQIAYVIDANPIRWGLEATKLALQLENDLPVEVILPGTPTGTMSAFAGLLMYVVGETTYGVCFLVSFFSFWGSVAFYRAVRWKLATAERAPVLVGLLFIPSVAFWTGGLVKEAFVVGFMGITCKAIVDLLVHRRILAAVPFLIGIEGMALTKPYVLVALVIAIGAWFYAQRPSRLSLEYKLMAGVVVGVGMVLVARRFPEFSPENVANTVAVSQHAYSLVAAGGSNIDFGEEDAPTTINGQLKWAPLGLLNSLARPFLFEAKNMTMLLAALEITVLLTLLLLLVKRHGPLRIWNEVRRHPPLLFAVVLVLTFGTSIGIATKNLGTLSRYRVPMMPLYAASVLMLRRRMALTLPARKSVNSPASRQAAIVRDRIGMSRPARRRVGQSGQVAGSDPPTRAHLLNLGGDRRASASALRGSRMRK